MSDDKDLAESLSDLIRNKVPSLLRSLRTTPWPTYRHMMYGFPMAVVEPGAECRTCVELKDAFQPTKLLLAGQMDVIRGTYWLKHSRLPLLDRDDVVAYTEIKRRASRRARAVPGRTVVEYRGRDLETGRLVRSFKRSYLPANVIYEHTDPLSYIRLLNIVCGTEPAFPTAGGGVVAQFFSLEVLGNGVRMPPAGGAVMLVFKNDGDVQVRVRATIAGVQRVSASDKDA